MGQSLFQKAVVFGALVLSPLTGRAQDTVQATDEAAKATEEANQATKEANKATKSASEADKSAKKAGKDAGEAKQTNTKDQRPSVMDGQKDEIRATP